MKTDKQFPFWTENKQMTSAASLKTYIRLKDRLKTNKLFRIFTGRPVNMVEMNA